MDHTKRVESEGQSTGGEVVGLRGVTFIDIGTT